MKKIYNFIIILLIIFPVVVSAKTCSKEEVDNFNKIVNDIKIEYIHDKDNLFKIKMSNISKEVIVVDENNNQFTYNSNNSTTHDGYEGGRTYKFNILPIYYDCELDLAFSRSIIIPKYNIYSSKKECSEYKDFELCNKYYDGEITNKTFKEKLNEYKKNNRINSKYIFLGICITNLIVISIVIVFIINNNKKHKLKK